MDLIETSNNSNRHPWELSRTRCLINEIKKSHSNGDILDIGSGDMYFDKELLKNNVNINSLRGIDINLKENIESNKCKWLYQVTSSKSSRCFSLYIRYCKNNFCVRRTIC